MDVLFASTWDCLRWIGLMSEEIESLLKHGFATCDPKDRAADVAGVGAGKEDVRSCYLGGLSGPAKRGVLTEVLDHFGIESAGDQGGPDGSGCDRVNADTSRAQLCSEVDGEVVQCGFCRCVVQ